MKHLLSSITLLLLSTLAFGQVPNSFSSGETISSSKINANFAYLADAMAKGNVEAMMICQDFGSNSSGLVFGHCSSKDNSTQNLSTCGWTMFNSNTGYENYMSLSDVLNGK